jgi:hypothetical protein
VGFHNYIQERTADGSELTDFVLSVFRDENASNKERMDAATWLADRGFGKPTVKQLHRLRALATSPSSLVTTTQEVTRLTICPEIEATVPILFQRTIRKPLITSGAGFNGHQYGMNSGNGLSGNV